MISTVPRNLGRRDRQPFLLSRDGHRIIAPDGECRFAALGRDRQLHAVGLDDHVLRIAGLAVSANLVQDVVVICLGNGAPVDAGLGAVTVQKGLIVPGSRDLLRLRSGAGNGAGYADRLVLRAVMQRTVAALAAEASGHESGRLAGIVAVLAAGLGIARDIAVDDAVFEQDGVAGGYFRLPSLESADVRLGLDRGVDVGVALVAGSDRSAFHIPHYAADIGFGADLAGRDRSFPVVDAAGQGAPLLTGRDAADEIGAGMLGRVAVERAVVFASVDATEAVTGNAAEVHVGRGAFGGIFKGTFVDATRQHGVQIVIADNSAEVELALAGAGDIEIRRVHAARDFSEILRRKSPDVLVGFGGFHREGGGGVDLEIVDYAVVPEDERRRGLKVLDAESVAVDDAFEDFGGREGFPFHVDVVREGDLLPCLKHGRTGLQEILQVLRVRDALRDIGPLVERLRDCDLLLDRLRGQGDDAGPVVSAGFTVAGSRCRHGIRPPVSRHLRRSKGDPVGRFHPGVVGGLHRK